jgi:hypothetical protein
MVKRKRQLQVRADQKAAESVYWKSISERMSAERRAGAAVGEGSKDANDGSRMDVEPDTDADGD